MPKLAFWKNQRVVREPKSGAVIQILDGTEDFQASSGKRILSLEWRSKMAMAVRLGYHSDSALASRKLQPTQSPMSRTSRIPVDVLTVKSLPF